MDFVHRRQTTINFISNALLTVVARVYETMFLKFGSLLTKADVCFFFFLDLFYNCFGSINTSTLVLNQRFKKQLKD